MNYGTGQIIHAEVDLSSDAFGIRWGHTRSYTNILTGSGGNGSSMNGSRWLVRQMQVLKFADLGSPPSQVIVESGANGSQYFTLQDGVYRNQYTGWNALVWRDTDKEFVLTSASSGQQWIFYDQTVRAGLRGQLKRVVDSAGRAVTCSYNEKDLLEKFEQVVDGQTSGFYYTWTTIASVKTVTLKLQNQLVRRVSFTYYQSGDTGGNLDDLRSATIEQYDVGSGSWLVVERKHYRYYLPGQANGFTSGLKIVIGASAYQQMLDAGLNPESATETELLQFADLYYQYDAQKRVSLERLEGGRRQYSFAYLLNAAHDGGVNTWYTRTIETLPDGSQNRVYTNKGYSVLVKILQEVGTSRQWADAYSYNDKFRPIEHAYPSAIASISEPGGSGAPLVVNLQANAGLIDVTSYYTATVPASGEVAGYVSTRAVKKGSAGIPEVTEKLKYDTQTVVGVSLYPIKERIVYPVAGMSDAAAAKTLYQRTWYTDGATPTFQVKELVTTQPVVSAAENGTGVAGVIRQIYDRFGRESWVMNQRGVITCLTYLQNTGAPLQRIEDANTDLLPDAPPGWVSLGQNLVTSYVSDALGRITQERGPWHEVQLRETDTVATAIRQVQFTAYDDENHETRQATGYMTGSDPAAQFTTVGAVKVTRRDASGRVVDEIQSTRCCATGVPTTAEPLLQTKWTRWKHRIYNPWGRPYAERVYFSIPDSGEGDEGVNYMETLYGYDAMGRENRVVDATGTIQRVLLDVRDLTLSQWTGTNDAGATNSDPTGGGTAGNNMVKVSQMQYDNGAAGGNGNLTQRTDLVDTNTANDRVTGYEYDYRDRQDSLTQTDGTSTWITKQTYNNRDRVISSTKYRTAVTSGNRIAENRVFFDAMNRVFKTEFDGIDPVTGAVTGTLTGQNWYDLVGNLIKQSKPGSTAFTKTVFDAWNRTTIVYQACRPGVAGVPAGNDNSVVKDTVVEQSHVQFDAAGNVILQTTKKRFDDAVGTGPLNSPQAEPKSRNSFTAYWPDAIGRQRVTANYGTNGGLEITRPAVAPARSDTILVSTNRYKDSGDNNATIDPMGIETRWENDHAGRRIRLIEGLDVAALARACVPDSPTCANASYPPAPTPRTTEFAYHASGQLSKLTLINAETGDQVTRWVYGTTLADSAVASNRLLRAKIYPESDDRPAPAADGPDGVYSRLEYCYNRQGEATAFKDADGTVHEYAYNKMGARTEDRVPVLAAALNGDVRRIAYSFDNRGLSSKVTSYNAVSGGGIVNEVTFEYDAFMQLSADKQSHSGAVSASTPKVSYVYETGGIKNSARRISTTYPTSSRVLQVQYGVANSLDDHLGRVSALQVAGEATALVNYTYCGWAWQVRVGYSAPGLELTYRRLPSERPGDAGDPYAGYDRYGRTVDMPWVKTSNSSIVERSQYGFNRNSQRTWQKRPLVDTQDQQYQYDSLSQVSAASRGSLNLNATAISGIPAAEETWGYDPTGNWQRYQQAQNGTETLDQSRVHDRGNRLTQIEDNPNAMILDRAGRMRQLSPDASGDWNAKLELTWDAWSRITQVRNNGVVVGTYQYDGLYRRITRETGGITLHSYYNDVWRPLEERQNSETTPTMSYLWGARHRDDLARRDRAVGGTVLNETRYMLMDYFNPSAITDGAGVVKERYAFSAFGVLTFLTPDYTPRTTSECAMEFGFQGQFLDVESGLINYGYRYYVPNLGRWTCKDPIGEKGGLNLYAMMKNDAINKTDLLGLKDKTCPTSKEGKSKGGVTAPPKPKGHKGFHHFGNWGGPGWANGGWNREDNLLPPKEDSLEPTGARDSCYKDHDYCIADCKTGEDCPCPEDKKKVSDCIEKCDHKLADCLRKAGVKGLEPFFFDTFIPWLVH